MKTQAEVEAERRIAAGLPVLTCPSCKKVGARHWVPQQLDENGLMDGGYFTCKAAA